MSHGHYSKLCRQIKEKSGISDLSPKMFRKYCISKWERVGIPDAIIRKMSGHSKNSKAISHYSYHNQEDVDEAILKARGIKIKKEEKETTAPYIICKRCQSQNISDVESCEVCGFPVSQEKLLVYEQKIKESVNITERILKSNAELKNQIIDNLKKQIMEELREEIMKELKQT